MRAVRSVLRRTYWGHHSRRVLDDLETGDARVPVEVETRIAAKTWAGWLALGYERGCKGA